MDDLEKAKQQYQEALEQMAEQMKKWGSKSLTSIEERFKRLDKQVERSGGSFKDVINELSSLADAIEDDVELQHDSQRKKRAMDELELRARKAYNEQMKDLGTRMTGQVLQGFANYYVNQLKVGLAGLMGESSPFKMAADLQIASIDAIGTTFSSLGKTVETAGASLLTIPTQATMVAGGLMVLGGALLDFGATKAAEILKLKTQIVSDALEKTYNSFIQASSAGAIFAGGMTELRKYALQSGLTQEQFTKIVASSSAVLAESGYTVADATRIMGNITSQFAKRVGTSGQTLQQEMLNLGFSIEEQASITADVMATMRRLNRQATSGEMADAVRDYAKNLRIIADITGEDARKRVDQARKLTDEYAFQRKFLREHAGNTQALNDVTLEFAKMNPVIAESIKNAYINNGAVTRNSMYLTGYAGAVRESANVLHQQNFNMDEFGRSIRQRNSEFANMSTDPLNEAIGGATAALGAYGQETQDATGILIDSRKYTEENYRKAAEAAGKAVDPNDNLTKAASTSVVALQGMRNAIQTDLTGAITKFASDVPEILREFRRKLVEIGVLSSVLNSQEKARVAQFRKENPLTEMAGEEQISRLAKEEDWLKSKGYNKVPGTSYWLGPNKEIYNPGDPIMGGTGRPADMPKFAKGGIAEGSISGYRAELHGTEAVVPLPDNRTIPVKLDSSSLSSAFSQQNELLQQILRAMEKNTRVSSGILQNTY